MIWMCWKKKWLKYSCSTGKNLSEWWALLHGFWKKSYENAGQCYHSPFHVIRPHSDFSSHFITLFLVSCWIVMSPLSNPHLIKYISTLDVIIRWCLAAHLYVISLHRFLSSFFLSNPWISFLVIMLCFMVCFAWDLVILGYFYSHTLTFCQWLIFSHEPICSTRTSS